MRSILVAYDGSESSERALERTAELAREGATVAVVSVAAALHPMGGRSSGGVDPEELANRSQELDQAKSTLSERGIDARTIEVVGDPPTAIRDAATEVAADVIVVGNSRVRSDKGRATRIRQHGAGSQCAVRRTRSSLTPTLRKRRPRSRATRILSCCQEWVCQMLSASFSMELPPRQLTRTPTHLPSPRWHEPYEPRAEENRDYQKQRGRDEDSQEHDDCDHAEGDRNHLQPVAAHFAHNAPVLVGGDLSGIPAAPAALALPDLAVRNQPHFPTFAWHGDRGRAHGFRILRGESPRFREIPELRRSRRVSVG